MDWMLTSGEIRKAKAEAMGVSVATCNIEECDEAIAIAAVGNVMGWLDESCTEVKTRWHCYACREELRNGLRLTLERSTQER